MDQFQGIESGKGLLKQDYGKPAESHLKEALEKKRKKYVKDPEKIDDNDQASD